MDIKVDQLHVINIYEGLFACSNLKQYNENFLLTLHDFIHNYIPSHTPLHCIIPDSAPQTLPKFITILLLSSETLENHNIYEETFDGYWLGVIVFVNEISFIEISDVIDHAKQLFHTYAQGYFL